MPSRSPGPQPGGGGIEGSGWGGGFQAHTQGEVEGFGQAYTWGDSSRPTPRESPGPHPRGVSAPVHAGMHPPGPGAGIPSPLPREIRILLECILVIS